MLIGALGLSLILSPWASGGQISSSDEYHPAAASASPSAAQDSTPALITRDSELVLSKDKRARGRAWSSGQNQGVRAGSGVGIREGMPLEMLLWGGGGAIVGSIGGPVGAVIGGSIGSLIGAVVGAVMTRKSSPRKAAVEERM
jgi:hypothetical protein